jgi:CheY-like chemotaxis protein
MDSVPIILDNEILGEAAEPSRGNLRGLGFSLIVLQRRNAGMSSSSNIAAGQQSARKTLISHIRHELRTPLNAIIGYSEMILEDVPETSSEARSLLVPVHAGGKTLLDLVNTLLDANRVTADNFETQAAELCRRMVEPLNTVLRNSDRLIHRAAEWDLEDFLDDFGKIHDAGIRLQGQVDDIQSGSLAGGSEASSEAKDRLAAGVKEHLALLPAGPVEPRPDQECGRVLVVDDVAANREVLARRLEREGHSVTLAADGPEALKLAREQPFDLILLDILMPGMSGVQVLQQLKADPERRHIPVVMISALDEMDSVARSIEMGAEDHLPKPFDPVLLRARVGACLEKKRLRDREVKYLEQIQAEKERADALLHVILPAAIVKELKATNKVKPRRHENVAVMFVDLVGFTTWCEKHPPEEVVNYLQRLTVAFEEFAVEQHILKIKTIGDAFMAACGMLDPVDNPVLNCVRCGLKMIEAVQQSPAGWHARMGLHVGSVVAGVLGNRQYLFDLWGDTVNTAARMESHGVPGAIALSEPAYLAIRELSICESRGTVHIKGKGEMKQYVFREFRPGVG